MKTTFGALACLAVLTGCSSGTVDGAPAASDPGATEPAFSPCDDIPDDTIRALGMDPATESRDIQGVKQPGWNICRWNNDQQFLGVMATTRTADELRSNTDYRGFAPTTIAGRPGYTFLNVDDEERAGCYAGIPSGGGAVMFHIRYDLAAPPEDPCVTAIRSAASIAPFVPS